MARARNAEGQAVVKDALQLELEKLEKDFGKGSLLGSNREDYEVVSTGSLALDIALGIDGLAFGKAAEFIGWESSGKSTVTLHVIANAQRMGKNCLLIDGENSFDPKYAQSLGINLAKLIVWQADEGGGERAYDVAERLIKTKMVQVVVIDSQTALLPKKMIDDPAESSNIGLHARLLSRVVNKLNMWAALNKCLMIYISQFREKIGVMYGNPETTSGGHALKFYSHVRIEFRKSVLTDDAKNAYANKTKAKVIKNKLAPPFKSAEFDIKYGEGIDKVKQVMDVSIDLEIITKAGSWYSYKGTNIGQGEDAVMAILRDNPGAVRDLSDRIKEKMVEVRAQEKADREARGIKFDEEGETMIQVTPEGEITVQGPTIMDDTDTINIVE